MKTTVTTYDKSAAERAERQMNARRHRIGFPASRIRSFQKSAADGKGDQFTITLQDGEPVDITCEFDAIF